MYRKKMELNELWVCVCLCVWRVWCNALCVFGSLVCVWAPRTRRPQSSFPRCPTFPVNLLLTLAPNLSQRSLLRGGCGVGGLGMWALWQLQRRCSLEQKCWGTQREKSLPNHVPVLPYRMIHKPLTVQEHTFTRWRTGWHERYKMSGLVSMCMKCSRLLNRSFLWKANFWASLWVFQSSFWAFLPAGSLSFATKVNGVKNGT